MAWLRNIRPRSAALPAAREHGSRPDTGAGATATPAPDAEAARGPGRDTDPGGARRPAANDEPPKYGEIAGVSYEAPGLSRSDDGPEVTSFAGPPAAYTAGTDPDLPDPVPPDTGLTGIDDLLDETDRPADPLPLARPAPPQASQPPAVQPRPVSAGTGWRPVGPLRAAAGGGSGAAGAGGGQPRRARDLALDMRMQFWRSRLLIVAVVFVVFTIIGNWVIGLTLAIIAGIADTILRAPKAASLPPGVKLDPAQRRTQRQLSGMERRGYRALHRRPIPNSPEFIDHLVIGPTGVYAIDSEKWDKRLPVRTRNGKQLWLGPESKKARLLHAHWEAQQASELLSARLGQEIVVQPTMAIYGPRIPWDIAVIRDVDVFSGDQLRKYLHKRSRLRERPRLSASEIERIYRAAETVLPIAGTAEQATPVR